MADPFVTFDYATWVTRYPEFSEVSGELARMYFDEATLWLRNDGSGPVREPATQLRLLNMLTAHIAALNSGANGQTPSPFVGPITNASEGSVSVGANVLAAPGTSAWYVLTRYGAEFWAATAAYRRMHYRVPLPRAFDSFAGVSRPRRLL